MTAEIGIVYEDEHIVAIDKPAGIMVHGDGREEHPTVTNWFVERYPHASTVGEEPIETQTGFIERPGVVHRLDRDTTGVLLLAKTQEAHEHLKRQFQHHSVEKVYRALVYGCMKHNEYTVDALIGRSRNFGRWTAIPKALRGPARTAETRIKVLQRYEVGEGYSLIEARPTTGRTHQIRVHLQYLNHPIVADALYAGKRNNPEANAGFSRQALHAQEISFINVDGERVRVSAPIPEEFGQMKQVLR